MTLDQILESLLHCPSGCALWVGGDTGHGRGGNYGRVWYEGRMRSVHIVVWEAVNGLVPEGWHVDHVCARWSPVPRINRRCARLEHLQVLPGLHNIRLSSRWRR